MTASTALPVLIRRRSPEDIAARAHAVLHAALAVSELWDFKGAAIAACMNLDAALDEHQALASGVIHWEARYPELSAVEDPDGEALEKSASECALAMALLLVVIAAICGTEVADGIKAAAGEAS
jgi:hypothetical protein